jgi:hypothetical protein
MDQAHPNSPIRPRIGAYYYAWYDAKQWADWKTKYHPILGLYNSHNQTVLAQHFQWARQANIDFFIMSWSDQRNHDSILNYLSLAAQSSSPASKSQSTTKTVVRPTTTTTTANTDIIPIVIHVETLILFEKSCINTTRLAEGFLYMKEPVVNLYTKQQCTFGESLQSYVFQIMDEIILPNQQHYLIVQGNRPVFVIYLAREFVDFQVTMIRIRHLFYARYGVYPYFIADVVWYTWDTRVKRNTYRIGIDVWDAITAYNRFEGRSIETLDEYLQRMELEYRTYADPVLLGGPPTTQSKKTIRFPVVPYVQPGYDDESIRSHQHGPNGSRPIYTRNGGSTYDLFWDLAQRLLNSNPCHGMDHATESFVFVTTFNEWHESSSIEPSVEWGSKYLQQTYNRSMTLNPTCDASAQRPIRSSLTVLVHWWKTFLGKD